MSPVAILLLALCSTGVILAAEPPVAVSPGSPTGTVIADACPTFIWGGVDRAQSYEIVVYHAAKEEADPQPVLQQSFPDSVNGWTPSLDLCLERGGQYAWSVRSYGREGSSSDWSAANLFEVVSGPSEVEFEEALEVVRRYLEPSDTSSSQAPVSSAVVEPAIEVDATGVPKPIPRSHAGTGDGIVVINGAVAETKADPGCYPSEGAPDEDARFINCDNGTVLDTVTGLIWMEWANCRFCIFAECPVEDGLRTWYEANAFAASRQDGSCSLTDHSQAGDWRLPTKEEWEGINEPDCPVDPEIVGKFGGCYSQTESAWALDVVPTGLYWSSTTTRFLTSHAASNALEHGFVDNPEKTSVGFVWPVRGGQ